MRPLILSTSSLGLIHTWVTPIVENWAAYAPGFEELDENREYDEKEDEFDIVRNPFPISPFPVTAPPPSLFL